MPSDEFKKQIYFDRNIMTYKIMNKLCSRSLLDKYKPVSHKRKSQNLKIPMDKTEHYTKSSHQSVLKDCNNIYF